MARVSIYVSEELKARMDEARDALNWSDIARPAFEAAIATLNHRKGQNMQTAIERLRASKVLHEQQQETAGKDAGREWASNKAAFAELNRVAEIDLSLFGNGVNYVWSDLKAAIDPDDALDNDEASHTLFGDGENRSEEWMLSFVEGAQEFFAEVESQL